MGGSVLLNLPSFNFRNSSLILTNESYETFSYLKREKIRSPVSLYSSSPSFTCEMHIFFILSSESPFNSGLSSFSSARIGGGDGAACGDIGSLSCCIGSGSSSFSLGDTGDRSNCCIGSEPGAYFCPDNAGDASRSTRLNGSVPSLLFFSSFELEPISMARLIYNCCIKY